jgi:hypothetical protein
MPWIYYVKGLGKTNKIVAIGIGLAANPETQIAELEGSMPFQLELAGVEEGSQERLEALYARFQADHLRGLWYKPSAAVLGHIAELSPVDRDTSKTRRVSLDLGPNEFAELELMVEQTGTVTKARLLRKAVRFYRSLMKYKAQGFLIQAVKGGKLVQFPDLDDIH